MIELTLAMIVRDEQDNLDQCLRSARAHVDELVVVDTGSSDNTIAVAERHGAKVGIFNPQTNPESFFVDDEKTCAAFGAPGAYSGDVMLGDFGAARRKSFSMATGEFVFWLDADDVLENADKLRGIVADMKVRGLDIAFLPYDYARDDQGRVFYRQWRERVIRRDCASWVNPVHEVLLPGRPVNTHRYDAPLVVHRRKADRKSPPHRNYKILLRQLDQEKKAGAVPDPRTLFYLGQEARWVEPQKSSGFYEQYLKRSGWPEERAAAHVAIGSMLEFGALGGEPEDAYAAANKEYATAAAEMPENPDGLFGLARIAYLRGRWPDCVAYSDRAFKIGNTESMLGANPMDRIYRPHVYYNHALAFMGRVEEAAASCRAGLTVCPDDPGIPGGAPGMLKHNLAFYESQLAAPKAAPPAIDKGRVDFSKNEDVDAPASPGIPRDALIIWAMQLWKQVRGDAARERAILDGLPVDVSIDPVVGRMRSSTERRHPGRPREPRQEGFVADIKRSFLTEAFEKAFRDEKLKIVFWTGPAPEPWNPKTPNVKGLGGSETACIEMAKHLAALGHDVTVFGDPPAAEDVFEGVVYAYHDMFRGTDCDVFIASRAPWAVEQFGPVNARLKLLWVHDIHCGPPSPQMERWLLKFDRVLCLSEWHKGYFCSVYPTLHPDQVVVTRNGIDPERFAGQRVERFAGEGPLIERLPTKKNHMVWSSSPNRGLDMLLHNFQLIRQRVTDAELHIFYGCDTWQTMAQARGATDELAQIEALKKLIADHVKIGGVHWHGKRPQPELAAAFMCAKVWGYLSSFPETSCISAMEAQAAGCVPVASRHAALAETVKHGVLLDNTDPATPGRFVDECVRLMTDDAYREPLAAAGRKWAIENLSWQLLAFDWDTMFRRVIDEKAVDPLPRWKEVG